MELFLKRVYQFGCADETGLSKLGLEEDYDISAYAFSGDLAFKLDESAGFGVKPHIGFLYTSGDDDPTDDTLGGYTGVENAQRFSQYLVVRTPLSATPTWCWAACFTDTCQNSVRNAGTGGSERCW
ncbi:MAG: hypothetical protein R2860_00775 [Desulfobacterales bacterium]